MLSTNGCSRLGLSVPGPPHGYSFQSASGYQRDGYTPMGSTTKSAYGRTDQQGADYCRNLEMSARATALTLQTYGWVTGVASVLAVGAGTVLTASMPACPYWGSPSGSYRMGSSRVSRPPAYWRGTRRTRYHRSTRGPPPPPPTRWRSSERPWPIATPPWARGTRPARTRARSFESTGTRRARPSLAAASRPRLPSVASRPRLPSAASRPRLPSARLPAPPR
jgi:hypothetical protein